MNSSFRRRLAVLLIASDIPGSGHYPVVGDARSAGSDSESIDYAELLSAFNYPFEIAKPEDLREELLFSRDEARYAIIILAAPLSLLTGWQLDVLRTASYTLGISLLTAYDHPDRRGSKFFGIVEFKGKKLLRPLKLVLTSPGRSAAKPCIVEYGLSSSFSGTRRRGFRKLSWSRVARKAVSLLSGLKIPYMQAEVDPGAEIMARTMVGAPLVWSFRFGNAVNYYLGLHHDLFLDKFNEMHSLVRALIEANSGHGMVSADLSGTMVLRLDDPGASKSDYLNDRILDERDWERIGRTLNEKKACVSVMYTPGWVDDGDARSGELFLDGGAVTERSAGTVYDSPRVRYVSNSGRQYDHRAEYRGLENLVRQKLADVHSHGMTHLVPDHKAWAKARDRRSDSDWYQEFYQAKKKIPVPPDMQKAAMERSRDKIKTLFQEEPAVITPSSHSHDEQCDMIAREAGFRLFSSDYLGIIKKTMLIRNWKIPAVFLFFKEPAPTLAKAGYPVIGIVHDYELKKKPGALEEMLNRWSAHGITRFISLNNLEAALCCSIEARYSPGNSMLEITITPGGNHEQADSGTSSCFREMYLNIACPAGCSFDPSGTKTNGAIIKNVQPGVGEGLILWIEFASHHTIGVTLPVHLQGHKPDPAVIASARSMSALHNTRPAL